MKDIRIDNRSARVFVLKETDDRIVYIPLKVLHRVDYDRLLKIEQEAGDKMLERMSETVLDNGRNALVQYDGLIQVMKKNSETTGERLKKPEESIKDIAPPLVVVQQATAAPAADNKELKEEVAKLAEQLNKLTEQPARKKPGPKPKQKQEE